MKVCTESLQVFFSRFLHKLEKGSTTLTVSERTLYMFVEKHGHKICCIYVYLYLFMYTLNTDIREFPLTSCIHMFEIF